MSIYNRSYMRDDSRRPRPAFDALKAILIALVVVFLAQKIAFAWIGTTVLEEWLALTVPNFRGGLVYTLVTYGYLHDSQSLIPWHLLFNALIIYFAGRHLQERFGSSRLFELYHFCVLAGGLCWLPVAWLHQQSQAGLPLLVGASAGGFGLLSAICLLHWSERFTIHLYFLIPISLTGRTAFYIILGIQGFFFLFGELPGGAGNSAYSAHLGGILSALLYHQKLFSRRTLWEWWRSRGGSTREPSWARRGEATKQRSGRFSVNLKTRRGHPEKFAGNSKLRGEVDRILDKINDRGFGSLTEEEKRILDEAKDRLN